MAPMKVIWLLDIAFVHHFVATRLPHTLPPYRSANVVSYASKKLSR